MALKKELVNALRLWVHDNVSEKLSDLLVSLREIENRSDRSRRQLGWPSKEWSVGRQADDASWSLNLNIQGGAFFEILEDKSTRKNGLPPLGDHEAAGTLVLEGQVGVGANGMIPAPSQVSIGLEAGLKRNISYHYAFDSHDALSCLLYTSPSPRDLSTSRMPSSA